MALTRIKTDQVLDGTITNDDLASDIALNTSGDITTSGDISAADISAANVTLTGELNGPATFYIDPAPHDPDTDGATNGLVVIRGDLQVDGTTTTINSTTMEVDDLNITLASGALNAAAADGAGITVDGASATIIYDGTNDEWDFNKDINVTGNISSGAITSSSTIQGTAYLVGSTVIVNTNRDLTNIGTISSGAITSTGAIKTDYNDTIAMDYAAGSGDYYKGMTGTSFASGSTARGLHIFNFDNDTNLGINFWVGTNASKQFAARIDDTGNVGIGTTSPLEKLDVNSYTGISVNNNYAHMGSTVSGGMAIFGHNIKSDPGVNIIKSANTGYHSSMIKMYYNEGITFHATSGTQTAGDTFYNISGTTNELVRITNTGNVGIGISSPYKKLEVAGDIQLDAIDANIWLKSGATGTNGFINWTFNTNDSVFNKIGMDYDTRATTGFHIDAGYPITIDATAAGGKAINFDISGVTKAVIDDVGNVGIGNTSPTSNLTIGSAQSDGLEFTYDGTNAYRHRIANYWNSNTDSRMDFEIGRSGGVAPQTILSVGYATNVGIGTTSPSAKLHIDQTGNTRNDGLFIERNGSTYGLNLYVDSDGYGVIGGNGGFTPDIIKLDFNQEYVGIGANPVNPLHIKQSNGSHLFALETSYATDRTGRGQISWRDSQNITGGIWTEYDGTNVSMRFGNLYSSGYNTNTSMIIRGNGNVGIGTDSPDALLDLQGVTASSSPILRFTGTGNASQGDVIGQIEFYNSDTTDNTAGIMGKIRAIAGPSGGEGSLQFLVDMPSEGADAATVALHLNANGNVGIGDSTPEAKLEVYHAGGGVGSTDKSFIVNNNAHGSKAPAFSVRGDNIISGGENDQFYYMSKVYYRAYVASSSGAHWYRVAKLPSRDVFEVTFNTTGGWYGPGSTTIHIMRDWNLNNLGVATISKVFSQYVTNVRMQSDNGGGSWYLEAYFSSVNSNQLSDFMRVAIRPLGPSANSAASVDNILLDNFGQDPANLTYTSASIAL